MLGNPSTADSGPPPGAATSRWTWRITIGLLLAVVLLPAAGVGYYALLIHRRRQVVAQLEQGPYLVSDIYFEPWHFPLELALTTPFSDKTELMVEEVAQIRELHRLTLGGGAIDDNDLQKLAALRSLKTLHLEATDISDKSLESIGQLPTLGELDLSATRVTDRAVETLAAMQSLKKVRLQSTLISQDADRLRQSRPDLEVVYVPAQGPEHFGTVREVIKRGGLVGERNDNGGTALMLDSNSQFADWAGFDWSRLKHIPNVQFVRLRGFERPGEILSSLADFSAARTLALVNCPVSTELMKRVAGCRNLEVLVYDHCDLERAVVELLAGLEQLQELTLAETDIEVSGMRAIVSLPKLKNVTFNDCKFADGLFRAVALPQHWESLEITSGNLTDQDVEQIIRCRGLTRLWLFDNPQMTEASIDLVLTLPNLMDASVLRGFPPSDAEDRLQATLKQRREAMSASGTRE